MRKALLYISIGAIGAILLMLKFCNKPPEGAPEIKTVKEQQIVRVKDSVYIQKITDSLSSIAKYWQDSAAKSTSKYYQQVIESRYIESQLNSFLAQLPTDNPEINELRRQFKLLTKQSFEKDNTCLETIAANKREIKSKEDLLGVKDEAIKLLRKSLDTCFTEQKKLEDYTAASAPKRRLYVGGGLMGGQYQLMQAATVSIGLMNKRGEMYEVEYVQPLSSQWLKTPAFKISYKTYISLRRKK